MSSPVFASFTLMACGMAHQGPRSIGHRATQSCFAALLNHLAPLSRFRFLSTPTYGVSIRPAMMHGPEPESGSIFGTFRTGRRNKSDIQVGYVTGFPWLLLFRYPSCIQRHFGRVRA